MSFVYVTGTPCKPFGKLPDKSSSDPAREAYLQVIPNTGMEDGGAIDSTKRPARASFSRRRPNRRVLAFAKALQ